MWSIFGRGWALLLSIFLGAARSDDSSTRNLEWGPSVDPANEFRYLYIYSHIYIYTYHYGMYDTCIYTYMAIDTSHRYFSIAHTHTPIYTNIWRTWPVVGWDAREALTIFQRTLMATQQEVLARPSGCHPCHSIAQGAHSTAADCFCRSHNGWLRCDLRETHHLCARHHSITATACVAMVSTDALAWPSRWNDTPAWELAHLACGCCECGGVHGISHRSASHLCACQGCVSALAGVAIVGACVLAGPARLDNLPTCQSAGTSCRDHGRRGADAATALVLRQAAHLCACQDSIWTPAGVAIVEAEILTSNVPGASLPLVLLFVACESFSLWVEELWTLTCNDFRED